MSRTNRYAPSPWVHPSSYFGATWDGWLVFLCRNRDSDLLTNHNFETALAALRALNTDLPEGAHKYADSSVCAVRESHWAVGWVEWIAIHPSNVAAVAMANEIAGKLDAYPVLDEDRFSERETASAYESWDRWSVIDMLEENAVNARTVAIVRGLSLSKEQADQVLGLMESRGRIELREESYREYGSGRNDMAACLRLIRGVTRG